MRHLYVAGSLFIILGVTFHLQGMALVGPESSFMYANPDWTAGGLAMALAGVVIILARVVRKKT